MTDYITEYGETVSINEEDICYIFPGTGDFKSIHIKNGRVIYAKNDTPQPPKKKIHFIVDEETEIVIEDNKLPKELPTPTAPPRKLFRGWYYDIAYTEEAKGGDPVTEETYLFSKYVDDTLTFCFKNSLTSQKITIEYIQKVIINGVIYESNLTEHYDSSTLFFTFDNPRDTEIISYSIYPNGTTYQELLNKQQHYDILNGNSIELTPGVVPPPPTPPSEYFETLKYIETSGDNKTESENGQYIDIPYYANSDMIYYLTAQITWGPIGTSIAATAKTMFAKDFGKTRGGGGSSGAGKDNIYFLYDEDGWYSPTKVSNGGDSLPHTYVINYYDVDENGKGYIQVDNNEKQRFARKVTSFVDKYTPFSLGSWAEWGAEGVGEKVAHMWCAKSKIYGLYIKNGKTNASVINLVPVIVIKDYTDKKGIEHKAGTVGVYDESTDEFYKNVGKGTLGYEKQDGTHVEPTL